MNTLQTAVGVIVYIRGDMNTLQTAEGEGPSGMFYSLESCGVSNVPTLESCEVSNVPTFERCEVSYVPTFGRGG